jgi:para-aminobenzoate synthetase component I
MKNSDRQLIDSLRYQFRDEEMILLESQLPGHASSVCSYLAIKPVSEIRAFGSRIEVITNGNKQVFEMNPWEALKHFRKENSGWIFGYLGYDLKNFIEKLTSANTEYLVIPDMYFMQPSVLLKIENGTVEHITGDYSPAGIGLSRYDGVSDFEKQDFIPSVGRHEYIRKVHEIKELIKDGNFYELNFSYPITGTFTAEPYSLYKQMRSVNPVPFGAFLHFSGITVCCLSPERFLKKSGKKIISEPIKGTSERGVSAEEDLLRIGELKNEKNRAENLMIVDLVRHDLSKVSETGSVRVTKLFDIQSFGTVHQLISSVESVMNAGTDVFDVIKSCFPMGSMTGAPKIEVMKCIEELENYKRGIYSGAIGYITPHDDFDFNVVIRTAILKNGQLIYPVGGAITSDSDPEKEWEETIIKAKNLTEVFSSKLHFTK